MTELYEFTSRFKLHCGWSALWYRMTTEVEKEAECVCVITDLHKCQKNTTVVVHSYQVSPGNRLEGC